MRIAVTGANGQLGRLVIDKLKNSIPAADIAAIVRTSANAAELGVTTREADYEDPRALDEALVGIDRLLLISSSEIGKRTRQHRNVIQAAKNAGVKRIVYTSVLHADRTPLSLAAEHLQTENELKASGIPFVILRNGWYTENYTGSLGAARSTGSLVGSAGEGRISSATRADYAEAAVRVLTTDGHEGKTYELAGDEAYRLRDLAAEASRQTGTTLSYKNLPQEEYAALLSKLGVPEGLAEGLASWDVDASRGALFDDGRQLSALIGRPTTPLSAAVAEALSHISR